MKLQFYQFKRVWLKNFEKKKLTSVEVNLNLTNN